MKVCTCVVDGCAGNGFGVGGFGVGGVGVGGFGVGGFGVGGFGVGEEVAIVAIVGVAGQQTTGQLINIFVGFVELLK